VWSTNVTQEVSDVLDMINQLIKVIGQEAVTFEEFLQLLERQRELLVANDIEGLNEVTQLQQQKLLQSRKLDRQRKELISAIKDDNTIEGDLTVARIVELADENQAERLRQLREAILGLNTKIAEVRDTNALLLNQSRDFISRTMTMLSNVADSKTRYDSEGSTSSDPSTIMVDRRI